MYCEKCGTLLIDGKCPNCNKDNEISKKRKNNRNITIFAIVLSIVSIGVLVGGFFVLSGPKTIVLQSISNWSGLLKKGLQSENRTIFKEMSSWDRTQLEESVSLQVDPIFNLGFDKANFKLTYNVDNKEKKSNFNLGLLVGENSLDLDGFLANNKFYLKIKDILDKYYYLDMEYISLFEDSSELDSERLIDIIFENLKDSIDGKDCKKSKKSIALGDDTKKVTKISYKVTYQSIVQVVIDILEDIKNDKKLISDFSSLLEQTEDQTTSQMEVFILGLKSEQQKVDQFLFYYNVYYYGFNNIVMEELSDDEIAVQYYHYNQTEELKIVDIDSKTNYFTFKAIEETNNTKISGFILTYGYQGIYTNTDDKVSLKVTVDFGDKQTLTFEVNNDIKEQKDSYQSQINLKLNGSLGGMNFGNGIQLSLLTQYKIGQGVDTTVIEDATPIEEMTEEDQLQLLDKISKHPLISSITEVFNAFIGRDSQLDDSGWDSSDLDDDFANFGI